MATLREALNYLEGARFENYSGQIIAEHANKNKDFILCDLTCKCSEVGSKNADEYGEVLVTFLNSATIVDILARIVADYRRSDEDARGVSVMEYLIEEAENALR